MNIAILTISSLSLVASAGCLAVMLKTAKELQLGKEKIETEVEAVKTKVTKNAQVVKTALSQLDI